MTEVADEEILFRRVRNEDEYVVFVNGKYVVTGQAFSDRTMKPSVDLASLCVELGGPAFTQNGEDNGVARLLTRDVRNLVAMGREEFKLPLPPRMSKEVKIPHAVDVHPCPVKDVADERDNPAHAELRPSPEWCNKGAFRRLLEGLEQIAKVEILPKSLRPPL